MQYLDIIKGLLSDTDLALSLIKSLPYPLFIKNKKGEYIYVNEILLNQTNKELSDFIFKTEGPFDDQHHSWMSNDIHIFNQSLPVERHYMFQDKTYRVIKFAFETKLKEKYLVGFAIEEENEGSEVLSAVFERLSETTNSSVVVVKNSPAEDFPIVFVNKLFEELTGYTSEDVLGKNCRFMQGPESEKDVKKQISEAIREGRLFEGVITNYKKDGTQFKNFLSIYPVYEKDTQRISYFVGIQKDYTKVFEKGDAVSKVAARYSEIYSNIPALVFSMNDEGIITDVNDFSILFFDAKPKEVIGQRFYSFLDEESKNLFTENIELNFQLTKMLMNEVLHLRNGKSVVLSGKKWSETESVFIINEILQTKKDFIVPKEGPWWAIWAASIYNYLPRKIAVLLVALILFLVGLGLGGYGTFRYHLFLPPPPIEYATPWAFLHNLDRNLYDYEKKTKLEALLVKTRTKFNANRSVIRFYLSNNLAELGLDLPKPGPTSVPIPRDFWVVNLNEPGYDTLNADFAQGSCHVRDRDKLDASSGLYKAMLAQGIVLIVSCADSGNSYFYTSLDFTTRKTDEEIAEISEELQRVSEEIYGIMGYGVN